MTIKRQWTKTRLKQLEKELTKKNPKSIKEITKQFGITRSRLYQVVQNYNLSHCFRNKKKTQMSTEEWRVYRLYKNAILKTPKTDLEFKDFLPLPTTCPYLGIKIDYLSKKDGLRLDNSPSLDKIDPTKGYVKGNVLVCSWRANRIKNNGTLEEHESICKYLRQRKAKTKVYS